MPSLRLQTPRLLLRPFQPRDLDDLLAARSRPEVVRYLYADVLDRRSGADWLRRAMVQDRLVSPGDVLSLAVEHEGRVIGDVLLRWASGEHRQGEIGFVFDPDAGGRGYATEAVAAVLELAFSGVRLHRVFGQCDARNTASATLMTRLGMRREAHLRENEWVKGEWTDELVFGVLAPEWFSHASPPTA
ncbi:MAG: GNAT family N-acetyltransferase [Mycobacteriaceae bacterium]